jgi:hypothetical protein
MFNSLERSLQLQASSARSGMLMERYGYFAPDGADIVLGQRVL